MLDAVHLATYNKIMQENRFVMPIAGPGRCRDVIIWEDRDLILLM